MIDITIQIITESATHGASNVKGLHLGGEIVNIHNRINEAPVLNRRLGFGHIDNVPVDNVSELMFLSQPNMDGGELLSRSLWRVDSTLLTDDELIEIKTTNQITAEWSRFKEVCKNVSTGEFLTDGDING